MPHQAPDDHVFSDASGSYGCGVFSVPMGWCQLRWPASWSSVNITEKELLPIVITSAQWGHWWQGRHICFHCDNRAIVTHPTSQLRQRPYSNTFTLMFIFFLCLFRLRVFGSTHPGHIQSCCRCIVTQITTFLFLSHPPGTSVGHSSPTAGTTSDTVARLGLQDWIALFLLSLNTGFHSQPDLHMLQANNDI